MDPKILRPLAQGSGPAIMQRPVQGMSNAHLKAAEEQEDTTGDWWSLCCPWFPNLIPNWVCNTRYSHQNITAKNKQRWLITRPTGLPPHPVEAKHVCDLWPTRKRPHPVMLMLTFSHMATRLSDTAGGQRWALQGFQGRGTKTQKEVIDTSLAFWNATVTFAPMSIEGRVSRTPGRNGDYFSCYTKQSCINSTVDSPERCSSSGKSASAERKFKLGAKQSEKTPLSVTPCFAAELNDACVQNRHFTLHARWRPRFYF